MKRTGGFIVGLFCGICLFGLASYFYLGDKQLSQSLTTNIALSGYNQELEAAIGQLLDDQDPVYLHSKMTIIYELLQEQYLDTEQLDQERMQENAVKGFVNALGDPYTSYLTIIENEVFDEELQGTVNFEGIGAVVTKKDQGVLIEELIKGGPAFQAGVLPLDLILEVNTISLQPLTISEAVQELRGPAGSEANLVIYRESSNEVLEITVVRDTISVPSVSSEIIISGDQQLLYIEVAVFGEDTVDAFEDAITEYENEDFAGILLDLRGNGGGYLPIAVELASYFLPENELVATSEYKSYPDQIFRSEGYGLLEGYPVVVLVDGISASASEILAGALQQRGGAVLVGTQTFGKGSIQTLHDLGDGSLLKYTVGEWFPPNGENVRDVGLTPDVEIEFDLEAYLSGSIDNQLDTAISQLIELLP